MIVWCSLAVLIGIHPMAETVMGLVLHIASAVLTWRRLSMILTRCETDEREKD